MITNSENMKAGILRCQMGDSPTTTTKLVVKIDCLPRTAANLKIEKLVQLRKAMPFVRRNDKSINKVGGGLGEIPTSYSSISWDGWKLACILREILYEERRVISDILGDFLKIWKTRWNFAVFDIIRWNKEEEENYDNMKDIIKALRIKGVVVETPWDYDHYLSEKYQTKIYLRRKMRSPGSFL